jgi:hypothetical protein
VDDSDLFATRERMQAPITNPRTFPRQALDPIAAVVAIAPTLVTATQTGRIQGISTPQATVFS